MFRRAACRRERSALTAIVSFKPMGRRGAYVADTIGATAGGGRRTPEDDLGPVKPSRSGIQKSANPSSDR
jgi:hypothetical protein